MKKLQSMCLLAFLAVLVACDRGSGNSSGGVSGDAFVQATRTLAADVSDSDEPSDVESLQATLPEDVEPADAG
jgi:hypothetical protein